MIKSYVSFGTIALAQYKGWTDAEEWKQLKAERLLGIVSGTGGESVSDPQVSGMEEK